MINKLGDRERVVKLWTELDDMKSCYQLINIMTKFEEETMRWLYIFIKKAKVVLAKYMKQGGHMMRTVQFHRYDHQLSYYAVQ